MKLKVNLSFILHFHFCLVSYVCCSIILSRVWVFVLCFSLAVVRSCNLLGLVAAKLFGLLIVGLSLAPLEFLVFEMI